MNDFYDLGDTGLTLFDDWLQGNYSRMPAPISVWNSQYRKLLIQLIIKYSVSSPKIISIGSGIGALESELSSHGFDVTASDVHSRAIEICLNKGLNTIYLDLLNDSINCSGSYDVVYLDGVLGHIAPDNDSLEKTWTKLVCLMSKNGICLISNDISGKDHCENSVTGMPDQFFYRPKAGGFSDAAKRFGFRKLYEELFSYNRRGKQRDREVSVLIDARKDKT